MKDLIQCAANHNDFKRWLELGHAPLTVYRGEQAVTTLTRLEKTSSVDYLYQIPVAKDNSISWNYSLTFCGVYERRTRALYLTEDSLKTLMKGTYPFIAEAGASVKNELCGKINQRVEDIIANDRKNLLVQEIQGSQALRDLQYYREHGAQEEAIKRFFDGNAPDGQFHSSYTLNELPEAAFLDYIQDPEGFIQNEAERLIKMNQEQFLLQFLKNDALLMKYEAVMQDTANPIHRVKAILEAIKISGAKSVNVTVQKDGEELSFKTGTTPLRGRYNSYSSSHIAAADRQEFERLFGRYSNYSAEDIIRITYGKKNHLRGRSRSVRGRGTGIHARAGHADRRDDTRVKIYIDGRCGSVREMGQDAFWELIAEAKERCGQDLSGSRDWLETRLTALGSQQAMDFQDILRGYQELANQYGLWCAACVMRPDASEDEYFLSFRNWLIAQGREVYMAALRNPDSLADVEPYGYCEFEELDNPAPSAVVKLDGQHVETSEAAPAFEKVKSELESDIAYGEGIGYPYEWAEMAGYLPRLCGKYLTEEELSLKIRTEVLWNPDHPEI